MCGRYTVHGQPATAAEWRRQIARAMRLDDTGAVDDEVLHGRFNVAPSQPIAVVERVAAGANRLATKTWGVRPPRSKRLYINARDDALLKRWSYLMAAGNRVAIPADGWYEWSKPEKPGGPKQPWYFRVDAGEIFAFAGLADGDEALIITTAANPVAAPVHNRMPAVLADPELRSAWLDPSLSAAEAAGLIGPLEAGRLSVAPANPLVNSWQNDGPELLEPAADR